jgi:hypothetical protein
MKTLLPFLVAGLLACGSSALAQALVAVPGTADVESDSPPPHPHGHPLPPPMSELEAAQHEVPPEVFTQLSSKETVVNLFGLTRDSKTGAIYAEVGVLGPIPSAAEQTRIRGIFAKYGDWPVRFRHVGLIQTLPLIVRAPKPPDAQASASRISATGQR